VDSSEHPEKPATQGKADLPADTKSGVQVAQASIAK
jgi:hypothetical protein